MNQRSTTARYRHQRYFAVVRLIARGGVPGSVGIGARSALLIAGSDRRVTSGSASGRIPLVAMVGLERWT
jgi:hypothetical protein